MVKRLFPFVLLACIAIVGILTAIETDPPPITTPKKWEVVHSASTPLSGIWGLAANDIWAYGPGSKMLHWDGSSWTEVSCPSALIRVASMWGNSADDIWAIGEPYQQGQILHWDGNAWSAVNTTTNPYPGTDYLRFPLTGIWGSNANDIWVIGSFGKILHWNGSAWSPVLDITEESLFEVWGFSANNVWAVGDHGCVMHWNGSTWSEIQSNTNEQLWGIWGSDHNDFCICGNYGITLHWNGNAFSSSNISQRHLTSLWGLNSDDIWATGKDVYHWDGSNWTEVHVTTGQGPYASTGLERIWAGDADNIWGVAGYNIFRYQ